MATWVLIGAVALVFGLIFDAVQALPYFVVVSSVVAFTSAVILMLVSGLDLTLIALGSLGASGILTSWDSLFQDG